jgi:hypothetical protein
MTPQVDSERLRQEAERILSHPRFRSAPTFSERLGAWLAELWYRFLQFLDWLAGRLGGPLVLGTLLLVAVVVVSILVARNLGTRRAREVEARVRAERALARGADPADLEREAESASRHGDFAWAVRLLFRAGLLRLDQAGQISFQPGMATSEVADRLDSPVFTQLARRFDEITYGHRPATSVDVAEARAGWQQLLSPVMSRP